MNMSRAGTPARPGNTRTPRLGLNRCVFTSTSRGPVMRTAPRGSRQVDEERDRPRAASFPRLTGRISETGHRLLLAARSRHLYSVISWKLKSASKPGTKRGEKERRREGERESERRGPSVIERVGVSVTMIRISRAMVRARRAARAKTCED